VQDLRTGEGGLLQVCMEGIGLLFANSKVRLGSHNTLLLLSLSLSLSLLVRAGDRQDVYNYVR